VISAAHEALDRWATAGERALHLRHAGLHKQLEAAQRVPRHRGHDPLSSCFDANGGLFETLLGAEDAIISDELNHASIIDGVRLCKAQRLPLQNNDMADLEAKLSDAADARFR
jgi:glycine C-acetyltransferase